MKVKNFVWGVVAFVVVMLLLRLLLGFGWVWALGIAFVAGAVIAAYLIARSRGERPKDVIREVARQVVTPDPGADERPIHEQLARLNQRVRLEVASAPVIAGSERLIDLLRVVAPQAQRDAAGAETTFDLVRLATDHLPRLVGEYLDLSSAHRGAQETTLVDRLQKLVEHVTKVRNFLDQGRLSDFEAARGFVDIKFNT